MSATPIAAISEHRRPNPAKSSRWRGNLNRNQSQRRVRRAFRGIAGAVTGVIAVVAAIAVAPSAQGAFPGANGRIAFASDGEVFVMNAGGSNPTQLTQTNGSAQWPDFSSDGSKIVFAWYQRGLFVMNAAGGGVTQLTNSSAELRTPAFSPDGSKIVWSARDETGSPEIFIMNADGTNQTQLTQTNVGNGAFDPVFSPDGSKIAFIRGFSDADSDTEIYVMDADGANVTQLTANESNDTSPDFSPDGSKIVFSEEHYEAGTAVELSVMNADGTNQIRLTDNPDGRRDYTPVFSPDGSKIAFAGLDPIFGGDGLEIFVMSANGSGETQLTDNPQWNSDPAWQPRPLPRTPTFSVDDVSVVEGDAGFTTATFTVTRSGDSSEPSSVNYKTRAGTATAGTDYTTVALSTLSFASEEMAKTVTVDVLADARKEPKETFSLVLSAPTGAVISDNSGTTTIVNDDDSAYVRVNDVSVDEGDSGTATAAFEISRSGNTTGTSTVNYKTTAATATAGDYTTVALTGVTFAAGETTKVVNVDVVGDTTAEANETFNLVLTATGAVLADATGSATIVDNEGPVTAGPATFFSVAEVSVAEGDSAATPASFTITRSGDTTGTSTVKYKTSTGANDTAAAGTDYATVALSGPLEFGAGETSKTVIVDVFGDTAKEANDTFSLVLSAATGGVISDNTATATIVNDDALAYLSVDDVPVIEGNAGTATATFTVTRTGNATGESTVKYKTSGGTATAGTDYSGVVLTSVTFAAGETTKTVSVDVVGDTTVEPNETFKLVLSAPTGAVISDTSGTATISNDD